MFKLTQVNNDGVPTDCIEISYYDTVHNDSVSMRVKDGESISDETFTNFLLSTRETSDLDLDDGTGYVG